MGSLQTLPSSLYGVLAVDDEAPSLSWRVCACSKMGKRRRLEPVCPAVMIKSRKRSRKIVTAFHKLSEEQAKLRNGSSESTVSRADNEKRMSKISHAMEQLGGRAAYQAASQLSVSFFNTSKWVIGQLTNMRLKPKAGQPPLKVLEVGAINTTLVDCSWLDVTAIDLLSRHSKILQLDYFNLPLGDSYHVIVASMVLNSVVGAERRGEMLRRFHGNLHTRRGHLFLMLPRSCLTHSRVLDTERFLDILSRTGFTVMLTHNTPKIAFFVCRAHSEPQESRSPTCTSEQAPVGGTEADEHGAEKGVVERRQSDGRKKRGKGYKHSKGPSWSKDFDVQL